MIVLEFRFPAGRWHATAWGTHVNEGVVEWPPSPWRICRALYATWFHKHQSSIPREQIRALVDTLIEAPLPRFALPSAVAAHTRHYMPSIEGKKQSKTKIFDTFVQVSKQIGQDVLQVIWDAALSDAQRTVLSSILESMSYFGRAESLVEACLLAEEVQPLPVNASPVFESGAINDGEAVKLLAPLPQKEFRLWREEILGQKVSTGEGRKKQLTLPEAVSDCLLIDTGDWKGSQWSQPPGSRWVVYRRPERAFGIVPRVHKRIGKDNLPTLARYAVHSKVAPDITQALSLGNRLHLALVKWSDGSSVFTGCDENRQPLKGHQHAFFLSEPSGSRGEVSYINVYAPMGFGPREREALERLNSVWDYDARRLQLALVSIGHPEVTQGNSHSSVFGKSAEWVSITPFVPTRHLKTRKNGSPKLDDNGMAIGSPAHDLLRLLASDYPDLPKPRIEALNAPPLKKRLAWLSYQLSRRNGKGRRANQQAVGFKLSFPEPVSGPIALGYGAHFGLGLFIPMDPGS